MDAATDRDAFLTFVEGRTWHVADFGHDDYEVGDDKVADSATGTVVSSLAAPQPSPEGDLLDVFDADEPPSRVHRPVFDLDVPAMLVPSSTPGHSHLYLNVDMSDAAYWKLCHALAAAGVLEGGYVVASESRGYTSARPPWVRKTDPTRTTQVG